MPSMMPMSKLLPPLRRGGALLLRHRWRVLGGVVVLMLSYAIYVEVLVQVHISGRLWPEPARVYASPTELYAGETLNADELTEELLRRGSAEKEIRGILGENWLRVCEEVWK